MLKIFSNSVSTPIASISFFRSFRNFRFISLVFFSLLILISCGDTTAASDEDGGGPSSCTTYGAESPQNKDELKAAIDKFYAECQNDADYSLIDVSGVTDMSELFKGNTDFNGDISGWDMSGVTSVNSMFEGATNFHQDLSSWVLKAGVIAKGSSSPTKMFYKSGMLPKMLPTNNFYQYTPADKAALTTAIAAEITAQGDEADLSIIDTSQVTDMSELFLDNATFNGYVATWDTSEVKTMEKMFRNQVGGMFNQRIGDWDTSKVETMASLFFGARSFNQPIGDWDTSSVTNMENMFATAPAFNQPIGNWNTENVTDMGGMFSDTSRFDQPIGEWDTSSVTDMNAMFFASAFNRPLKDWDTSKVKNFTSMFALATSFNQDLRSWSRAALVVSGNTDTMFQNATAMEEKNKATWMP